MYSASNLRIQIPCSSIRDVVFKRLKLIVYKLYLVQKLQEDDLPRRYDFAVDILSRVDEDSGNTGHLAITGHQSPNLRINTLQEGGSVAVAPFYRPFDLRI